MPNTQLQSITIYPVKSLKGLTLSNAFVGDDGLEFDRRFMLSDGEGNLLSARQIPELLRFNALIREDGLEIIAPDGEHLTFRYPELFQNYRQVNIWGTEINAQHCGIWIDEWLSEKIGQNCELLYFGEQSERFTTIHPDKSVAFADGYPLLLISEASLQDLNQRSLYPLEMAQFRTNLVISHCAAFAEDSWKRIRIGEVEFEVVKPCSRCVMTTYDARTAQSLPNAEPLRTLTQYRRGSNGEVYFGQNLVALNTGHIQRGDLIEVIETREAENYPNHAPILHAQSIKVPEEKSIWKADNKIKLTCKSRVQETADVVTFRFSLPEGLQATYKPGQFLTLLPNINGQNIARCYTLSSSPSRPADLAITVKQVTKGQVSNWLHKHLQVGEKITALPPQGAFHLNATPAKKLLLLSAGSGITPMLSISRYLSDTHSDQDIIFYHQARSETDLIAAKELLWLEEQNPNLKIIFVLSQAKTAWAGVKGRLDSQQLIEQVPDIAQRTVFCCGPEGFMQKAKGFAQQHNVPKENWFEESFSQPPGMQQTTTEKKITLTFNGKTVSGNNQKTLLKQAEDNGVNIGFGCRAGICGSCQVKLLSGEVLRQSELPLSEEDKDNGIILACSCIPQSDIDVEI